MSGRDLRKQRKLLNWRKSLKLIVSFWFLAVIIGMFIFLGTHQVSGQSMAPTFQDQDRILILKQVTPKRGDIVTFSPVDDPSASYVKRVIGVPGDHVLLRRNTLYLVPKEETMPEVPADVFEPTNLPTSTQIITVDSTIATNLVNYRNIPENHFFVEGDNHDHSTDSRNFGWIARNQIEGIVKFRYYPFSEIGIIS